MCIVCSRRTVKVYWNWKCLCQTSDHLFIFGVYVSHINNILLIDNYCQRTSNILSVLHVWWTKNKTSQVLNVNYFWKELTNTFWRIEFGLRAKWLQNVFQFYYLNQILYWDLGFSVSVKGFENLKPTCIFLQLIVIFDYDTIRTSFKSNLASVFLLPVLYTVVYVALQKFQTHFLK